VEWPKAYERLDSILMYTLSPASTAIIISGNSMQPFALVKTVIIAVSPVMGVALTLPSFDNRVLT